MTQKYYNFEKLTPDKDADISVYEEAIEFVFDNSDVTNIAISGAYGAGKSSVIESYEKKHDDKNFLHISLAHFEPTERNESEDSVKETTLEGKILNQLIHQIPVDRIPQTNFRVKKDVGRRNIIIITILLYVLLGSITFISMSNKIQNWVDALCDGRLKSLLAIFTNDFTVFFAAIALAGSAFICIYNTVKVQKNKNLFHKVTVQGNTIEIFENKDESYFDKYLNEVLYLFEQVEADVIVFEDMDRFNSNVIFERLREVNNLVNVHMEKEDYETMVQADGHLAEKLSRLSDNVKFIVMEDGKCGSCIIEMPDGIIDMSVDTQLENIHRLVDNANT